MLPESPDQPAEHAFFVWRKGREGLLSVPAKIVKAFVEQGDKRVPDELFAGFHCCVDTLFLREESAVEHAPSALVACSIIHPCPVCSQLELWILGVLYRARNPSVYNTHAVVEFLYGYVSRRRSGYLSRYESSGLNVDPESRWRLR